MTRFACVGEKVFNQPEQADNFDLGLELFPHLAFQGLRRRFAQLATAAGKGPKRIALGPVNENSPIIDCHAGDSIVETLLTFIERDHCPRVYVNAVGEIILPLYHIIGGVLPKKEDFPQ